MMKNLFIKKHWIIAGCIIGLLSGCVTEGPGATLTKFRSRTSREKMTRRCALKRSWPWNI